MGNSGRRIELSPLYVLHHRPWRDTSRMLDVFSREHGRLTLFARGVRGPRSTVASLLQPFRLLLVSWSGSGDAGQLTQVEAASGHEPGNAELPPAALMPAWYLNERLRAGETITIALRRFERELLELLGYGIEFRQEARDGAALLADAYYHFHAELGFVEVSGKATESSYLGRDLLAIAADDYDGADVQDTARRLFRAAIDRALEGRDLRTRAVARAVVRRRTDQEKRSS
jgi:DNA repair protein RecO (recombination protein O)